MSLKVHRIHVGNLPDNITESELVRKFRKYGNVNGADIKHKREAFSDKVLSTFCFIDIKTDDAKLKKCLQQLNGMIWDSHHLKVSLAKESFLQRLQKERETAQNSQVRPHAISDSIKNVNNSVTCKGFHNDAVNGGMGTDNTIKKVDSRDPLRDSFFKSQKHFKVAENGTLSEKNRKNQRASSHVSPASSLDVLKQLESFSSVWNDGSESSEEYQYTDSTMESEDEEEIIQDTEVTSLPEKIKELEETVNQKYDEKFLTVGHTTGNLAEERRIRSLTEKQKAIEEQKKAVKLALSDVNTPRVNKKVVFGDDDDNDDNDKNYHTAEDASVPLPKRKVPGNTKGMTLFEESDDETSAGKWQNDFEIKKQFEGKKGKQLLNLQSRFNNDERFTLDERFIDEDKEKSDAENEDLSPSQNEEIAAEREQQFQIISDILGQPVSRSKVNSESSAKPMVRFDPTKPKHMKYEVSKEARASEHAKKVKTSFDIENVKKKKVQREEKEPEPVSKETFYKVSDSLAEAFKTSKDTQSSGFSLLQMFGPSSSGTEKDNSKTISNNRKDDHAFPKMPSFVRGLQNVGSYDGDEDKEEQRVSSKNGKNQNFTGRSKCSFKRDIVQQESFFFQLDDTRLKEGDDFFAMGKEEEPFNFLDFKNKRRELRHLVNRKIQRNAIRAAAFKTKLGGRSRPKMIKRRPTRPKRQN